MANHKLSGKVIIVTGASDGIGREVALQLGKQKAIVVLTARRENLLEEAAAHIRASGAQALVLPADLCKPDQIAGLVSRTVQKFGRIDALINVAGVGWYDWLEEVTAAELQQQFQTNIVGMADLIRQVIPIMKKQRSGHIINMSSYASRIAVPPLTVYSSTKYAIEGLSDALRRELAPWNIHVTRVHPWAVKTKFNEKAAGHGGIVFPEATFAPILKLTGVSTTTVADRVIGVLEHPRSAIYVTRWRPLIELVMLINHFFPAIVDFAVRADVEKMWRTHTKHDLQAVASGVTRKEIKIKLKRP